MTREEKEKIIDEHRKWIDAEVRKEDENAVVKHRRAGYSYKAKLSPALLEKVKQRDDVYEVLEFTNTMASLKHNNKYRGSLFAFESLYSSFVYLFFKF